MAFKNRFVSKKIGKEYNAMKELKIGKMLAMAWFAPLVFMILYILSLQVREFVPPRLCFMVIALFVLMPIEIFVLLKENEKESGKCLNSLRNTRAYAKLVEKV